MLTNCFSPRILTFLLPIDIVQKLQYIVHLWHCTYKIKVATLCNLPCTRMYGVYIVQNIQLLLCFPYLLKCFTTTTAIKWLCCSLVHIINSDMHIAQYSYNSSIFMQILILLLFTVSIYKFYYLQMIIKLFLLRFNFSSGAAWFHVYEKYSDIKCLVRSCFE